MTEEKPVEITKEFLWDFQKIGKNGNPYEILDGRIAEYITLEYLTLIVLNGIPYIYRRGSYIKDEDGKILKAHIKTLIWPELVTAGRINRVYQLILMDYRLHKTNDDVNQYPPYWINFRNGMYDPKLQEMHEHKKEYYSINQIPHDYDPEAEFSGSVADQFLCGLLPDAEDREMFLRYAGYCMTRDTSIQKFFVIVGLPGSGKSTLINMLVEMIGKENISCITLQDLNERFTPTELLGKLLNTCADLPKKALEQVDMIKRITGEDQIKGEYKGGKMFRFNSYAKLFFSANEMPASLDEKSDAFYRRILMAEVLKKGPRIQSLKKGLWESMPGFIKECVAALTRLYLSGGEIDSPNSKRLVHEYHRESDSVQSFIDDKIQKAPGERIERGRLYEEYKNYCQTNEWAYLGNRSFYSNMRGKGFKDYKAHDSKRYFKDIAYGAEPDTALIDSVICRNATLTEGFHQATLEENAVFSGENK